MAYTKTVASTMPGSVEVIVDVLAPKAAFDLHVPNWQFRRFAGVLFNVLRLDQQSLQQGIHGKAPIPPLLNLNGLRFPEKSAGSWDVLSIQRT